MDIRNTNLYLVKTPSDLILELNRLEKEYDPDPENRSFQIFKELERLQESGRGLKIKISGREHQFAYVSKNAIYVYFDGENAATAFSPESIESFRFEFSDEAVLGGRSQAPLDAAVLGGKVAAKFSIRYQWNGQEPTWESVWAYSIEEAAVKVLSRQVTSDNQRPKLLKVIRSPEEEQIEYEKRLWQRWREDNQSMVFVVENPSEELRKMGFSLAGLS